MDAKRSWLAIAGSRGLRRRYCPRFGAAGYGSFVACSALIGIDVAVRLVRYRARHDQVRSAGPECAASLSGQCSSCHGGLGIRSDSVRPDAQAPVLPESSTSAMLIAVAISDLFGMEMNSIACRRFWLSSKASALPADGVFHRRAVRGCDHTGSDRINSYALGVPVCRVGGNRNVGWNRRGEPVLRAATVSTQSLLALSARRVSLRGVAGVPVRLQRY